MIQGCSDLGKKKWVADSEQGVTKDARVHSAFNAEFYLLLLYSDFLLDFFSLMPLYPAKQFLCLADTDSYPQPKNSLTIDMEETWTKFLSAPPFISFSPVRNDSNLIQLIK